MIDVRILSHDSIGAERLDAFKSHAGISDESRDDVIQGYLESAALKVSRYYNCALIGASVRLIVTDVESDEGVLLYMHPSSVTSVKNGSGDTVSYELQGSSLIPETGARQLVVEYTTVEEDVAWCELGSVVYNYALGLYQQQSPQELAHILKGF